MKTITVQEEIENKFKSVIEAMNQRFELMEDQINQLQREVDRLRDKAYDSN